MMSAADREMTPAEWVRNNGYGPGTRLHGSATVNDEERVVEILRVDAEFVYAQCIEKAGKRIKYDDRVRMPWTHVYRRWNDVTP